MKNTLSIGISCAALGFSIPALGGVGIGVRYIEFENPSEESLTGISDDGSTLIGFGWDSTPSMIIERGGGWETVVQTESQSQFVWSNGYSDDGSVISVSSLGLLGPAIWRDGIIEELPEVYIDGIPAWQTRVGAVSGDGQVVGVTAHDHGVWKNLIYRNGSYTDLGPLLGMQSSSRQIDGIDRTGNVLVINDSVSSAQDGGMSVLGGHAWLWDHGTMTEIPDLPLLGGDWTSTEATGVSSDGTTAFGSSYTISYDEASGHFDFGTSHSWIYRNGGLSEIKNNIFTSVFALDITDDGQTVLVNAGSEDLGYEEYLWSEGGGFVAVSELLANAGIALDGDSLYFSEFSGDGTILAGNIYTEGFGFTSIVVTIPTPGALLMLGGGLLMLSGRRR